MAQTCQVEEIRGHTPPFLGRSRWIGITFDEWLARRVWRRTAIKISWKVNEIFDELFVSGRSSSSLRGRACNGRKPLSWTSRSVSCWRCSAVRAKPASSSWSADPSDPWKPGKGPWIGNQPRTFRTPMHKTEKSFFYFVDVCAFFK